jgi:hypothetical protein
MSTITFPTISNAFANSVMVGAIFLDSIKYGLRVKNWKNIQALHYPVLASALMLLLTMCIDGHDSLIQGPHGLITFAGITRTIAQLLIVGVCFIRTMTIHRVKKGYKIVTYAITAGFVIFIVFQRVVGTIAEWQTVNTQLLQATRIGINICSVIGVLYFELYTTFIIYGSSNAVQNSVTSGGKPAKSIPMSIRALAYSYTFGIVFVFVYQLVLASLRFAGQRVTATNLMNLGWALILKRIMEFRDDYEVVRDSSQSGMGSQMSQASQVRSNGVKPLMSVESK